VLLAGEQALAAETIQWHHDPDRALALAREEGKPVLIDFWAIWCPPCREMEYRVWAQPEVIDLADKFVFLRIDVDDHPEVMRRYRADALPTVVVIDPWGTEIARRVGFSRADEYLEILNAMPADFSQLAVWYERLSTDKRDFDALRELGLAYHRMQLFQVSSEFLDRALDLKVAKSRPDALAEIRTVIGWNYLKTGKLRRAMKSFERCLKEVPSHPALDVTLYGLFAARLASGKKRKAEPLVYQLESCCPESALTLRARSELGPEIARGE
jgi:thiol-disulfide isomerase/thioredoxin